MTREEILNTPKCPGIYLFTNTINNKHYVGQSICLRNRVRRHLSNSKSIKFIGKHLYDSMKKYGIENYELTILETIDPLSVEDINKELDKLEIYYIAKYDSFNNGYNETIGGGAIRGYKHSEETRKKISENLIKFYKEHPTFVEYSYKPCWAYNFKEKFFENSFSRTELARILNSKYGTNFNSSRIANTISGTQQSCGDFVFGNTKEECLERLKFFETQAARHSVALAPNYQEYLEYLKTIVDKNGYLPPLEEIAKHYNRAKTTIVGWNKHIQEYVELDKYYNRLKLIGYTNSNIDYKLEETKPRYIFYNIVNDTTLILNSLQITETFNITFDSARKLVKEKISKGTLYKEVWKISTYEN